MTGVESTAPAGPARAVSRRSALDPLLAAVCALAVFLCALLSQPFTGTAFNDDWAYAQVALKLAETGSIQYNGWGSPMLLLQAPLGAAAIHLFGFSFNVLRWITLIFAAGSAALCYALARRCRLEPPAALLAALTFCTSPLFTPLASSFMTDIYGVFFLLLMALAAIGAATSDRRAEWNIAALTLAGLIGGANRQIVWVVLAGVLAYLAWQRRANRRIAIVSVMSGIGSAAVILMLTSRFRPPYGLFAAMQSGGYFQQADVSAGASLIVSLLVKTFALAFPAVLVLAARWRSLPRFRVITIALLAILITLPAILTWGAVAAFPWIGNMITDVGILRNLEDAPGQRPALFPPSVQILLTPVFLAISAVAALIVIRSWRGAGTAVRILSVMSLAYVATVVPSALLGRDFIFDRYALPLIAVFAIVILDCARRLGIRAGRGAWFAAMVWALFGIAITHDYCATLRAKDQAVRKLERAGVPLRHITAGFEMDGWSQLQVAGLIMSYPRLDTSRPPIAESYWFWRRCAALSPRYFVAHTRQPNLLPLWEVTYETYLPPFARTMFVQRVPDSLLPSRP